MKLQDYIHYYIGAKCTVVRYDKQEYEDIVCYGLLSDYQRRDAKRSDHIFMIKPVLNRLKDLTLTELEALALIYSGAKRVNKTQGVASNWHYFICHFNDDKDCELLVIGSDGCAWYRHYFDKTEPGSRNIVNEHEAFHFLLQRQYDLFGLIDAGFAIDAKTVNA